MIESMHRRRRINGEERDAYSKWARTYITALSRAGTVKKTKRRTHKRERREGKLIPRADEY